MKHKDPGKHKMPGGKMMTPKQMEEMMKQEKHIAPPKPKKKGKK